MGEAPGVAPFVRVVDGAKVVEGLVADLLSVLPPVMSPNSNGEGSPGFCQVSIA